MRSFGPRDPKRATPAPAGTREAWPASRGRRRLLELLLGSGLAASLFSFIYPVLKFVLPPKTAEMATDSVVAARSDELSPNSGKIFRFGNKPGILLRLSSGEYRAFTAICTHLACIVQYRPREQDIWCACHNGIYDLHGRNVSGPPPRPLEDYDARLRGEEVVVSRRSPA